MNNEIITISRLDLMALIAEITAPMESRIREHLKDAVNDHIIPNLNNSLNSQRHEMDRALKKVDETCVNNASVTEQLRSMHELIASFNEEKGALKETVQGVKTTLNKHVRAGTKQKDTTAFQIQVIDQQLGKLEKKINSKFNRLSRRLTDLEMKVSAMTLQDDEEYEEQENPVVSRDGSVVMVDFQRNNNK